MSEKVYNTFKIEDVDKFAAEVDRLSDEDLKELHDMLSDKIAHMVFNPGIVLKLSVVETRLERMSTNGETK